MARKTSMVGYQDPNSGLIIPRPYTLGTDVLVTPDDQEIYHTGNLPQSFPWTYTKELSRYSSIVQNGITVNTPAFSDTYALAVYKTDEPCIHRNHPGVSNYVSDLIPLGGGVPNWHSDDVSGCKIIMGAVNSIDGIPYLNVTFAIEHVAVYKFAGLYRVVPYGTIVLRYVNASGNTLQFLHNSVGGWGNFISTGAVGWTWQTQGYGPLFLVSESATSSVKLYVDEGAHGWISLTGRLYQSGFYLYMALTFNSGYVASQFGCGYGLRWFTTVVGSMWS